MSYLCKLKWALFDRIIKILIIGCVLKECSYNNFIFAISIKSYAIWYNIVGLFLIIYIDIFGV